MPDNNLLQAILNDPRSSPEEKEQAQRELDALSGAEVAPEASDEDRLSTDAREMLLVLKLKPLALFMVSIEQLDGYCKRRHITGPQYDALYEEWRDYHLPSDEWLRLLYLADPTTDIHWAWLAHWRNVLATTKKRLVRQFAEYTIGMLSKYERVPADVRAAASDFLARFRQIEEGQPLPEVSIPCKERWAEMPHRDLSQRMSRLRELQPGIWR